MNPVSVPPIRLVKRAHACVELQRGPDRIVVDPGALGEAPPLDGCAAVLLSHGHFDHASRPVLERAARVGAPVLGPSDLPELVDSAVLADWVTALRPGDRRTVGGFQVDVVGGRHARMHPERTAPQNLGYLIDSRILITGDEHPTTTGPVEVLVTPVDAPWLRAIDLIEFVRRVGPAAVIGVHDGLLNDAGLAVADAVLTSLTREGVGSAFRLACGEHFQLSEV
ncbi:MAG TPA: MBL fold metallo-hydrolase [Nocardioidaceae bacterium]|jgi:L-ascorbate metabolism protein UlaG (beta-lactamase superfamily)|nr:MBL fold metallo-hydrolase [Nocardioidaceae bacterium]